MQPAKPRIDILALPETTGSVLYCLYEILDSADSMWTTLTGADTHIEGFDVRIASPIKGVFTCIGKIPIMPQASLEDLPSGSIIIAPDFLLGDDFQTTEFWQASAEWIRDQHARGSTICSVCTGAALLAETGLLNDREATTHWAGAELLQSAYPEVKWKPDLIFSCAIGDESIITTGGASSWMELCLYLIKRFFGYDAAARTAKIYLLGDRSDGQLPFTGPSPLKDHDDAVIRECQSWIADHYDAPQPVSRMIKKSGLAERTFKRRFTSATGMKPVAYVQTIRVEEAKQLLETTHLSVEEISAAVGYEDSAFFRRLFKRTAGVSPAKYRQKYQAIRNLGKPLAHLA
ncbi:GlxA family transcriptional regulator [Kordiimonas lacus]|uniref:Transcriptional regulator GlxA family, contains an amidase domain and an AraC-type DNA-binding HTH domain n=1 Tax=Kordiimonas lacus TaxID=637679 RepID=A0A1G6YHF7_9PROT|nr:helix-turn-helix domain-containing protein [Kordiimonas lacus]SDD89065.1 Transcriptional regulator GlxA family, contains an amidase domain and an AraC-type DNA-binding HTH domain [Kordiimonas lacus]